MKPAPQFRGPPATSARALSWITTNAGRFSFSVPRPYDAQLPSEGRPLRVDPVFIWQTPPTWFSPLDQHDRMIARSSTQPVMCGSQSETHAPDSPYRFHLRRDGRIGE